MENKLIEIPYKKKIFSWVRLVDLFELIDPNGQYYWAILGAELIPQPKYGEAIAAFENRIDQSENGLVINLEELKSLDSKIFQEYEYRVIGCKNLAFIKRYSNEIAMREFCDIVIELIDCSFWLVFAKDSALIEKLASNFKEGKFLKLN